MNKNAQKLKELLGMPMKGEMIKTSKPAKKKTSKKVTKKGAAKC